MKDSFETINFPLSTQYDGFNGRCDLGAGSNVVFMYIPSGVRVFFTTDSNSTSKIEAKQGLKIKTNHDCLFFTTIGTSSESMVIAHWGGESVNIELPPISTFESLNGFGLNAFNQLSKAMNPYNEPTDGYISSNSNTYITLYNSVQTCDKIDLLICSGYLVSGQNATITMYLDGVMIYSESKINPATYGSAGSSSFNKITLNSVNGKTLRIDGVNGNATSMTIQMKKYTLKA